MTSSKPRRYLSHVVHVDLLFLTVLTHRLPLRLTEPTVTQFFTITTDSKLSPHHPVPLLAVPTHQRAITVLQTHKQKYRHIAQPKTNKQTNNTPPTSSCNLEVYRL